MSSGLLSLLSVLLLAPPLAPLYIFLPSRPSALYNYPCAFLLPLPCHLLPLPCHLLWLTGAGMSPFGLAASEATPIPNPSPHSTSPTPPSPTAAACACTGGVLALLPLLPSYSRTPDVPLPPTPHPLSCTPSWSERRCFRTRKRFLAASPAAAPVASSPSVRFERLYSDFSRSCTAEARLSTPRSERVLPAHRS